MKFHTQEKIFKHWLEHQKDIKRSIKRIISNEDTANEILHEAMMKASKSCCSDKEIKNVGGWLNRIAYNCAIEEFKRSKKNTYIIPETGYTYEQNILCNIEDIIQPLCNLLHPKYAKPLIMADIQGIKQEKISQQLNLSLSATKSRIQRARQKLKILVENSYQIEKDEQNKITILPKKH